MAAVKISSVRRKAAQKFWAPQQDHRPLQNPIGKHSVGAGFYPARASTAPHVKLPVIARSVRTLAVAIRISRPQTLPCLKGGGPAEGWWRDTCGVWGVRLQEAGAGIPAKRDHPLGRSLRGYTLIILRHRSSFRSFSPIQPHLRRGRAMSQLRIAGRTKQISTRPSQSVAVMAALVPASISASQPVYTPI